ncbi:head GIN domain-containing protein [Chryseosolibacter indicus]|uniref:DUF2807 domain-containing protein n=1 Tax=Chryseosolibacter indicus TaxID=2782351 RepID=A0ABS5VL15_9BACT|nr:head GIN domain-containing protein [Chryseosolibacter indicus]MBT1702137.1 DUF2807 domain-containing protein [Chryseosolibacter indicus]
MKKYTLIILVALVGLTTSVFAQNRETRSVASFTKVAFRFPGKLYLKQGSSQKVELEGENDVLKEVETKVEDNKLIIGKEGKWSDWKFGSDDKITVYITIPTIEGVSVGGSGDVIGQGKITGNDFDLKVSGSGSLQLDIDAKGEVEADVSGSGDIDLKGKCRSFESSVSGSGKVVLASAISERAEFAVSGSGKIQASGSAESVKTSISGSGKVLAADLEVKRCVVKISGSGDVEISVKDELDASISGSGSVAYRGNPSKINSNASGSGKVRKL